MTKHHQSKTSNELSGIISLCLPAVDVHLDASLGVDGKPLVRIDCHAKQAGIGLYGGDP